MIVVVVVLTIVTSGAFIGAAGTAGSAFATAGVAATATTAATTGSLTMLGGAAVGAIGGAVGGGLSAGLAGGDLGDVLRGAAIGAVQGAITGGALHAMDPGSGGLWSNPGQAAAHIVGHGVVGGAANAAMGGKFQDGFLSAAVSAGAADAGAFGAISGSGPLQVAERTAIAGVVGGTASALGGGKFANGAYTAAFQHLLNYELGNVYRGFVPVDADGPQSSGLFPSYKTGYSYDYKNDLTIHTYEILPCTDLPIQDVSGDVFTLASFFFGGGEIAVVQAGTKRAFWSGIGANVATKEASALGLRTLESTWSAKILMATQRFLPRSFVDKTWVNLSRNWASGSNGAAHFFGPLGEGAVRSGTTWQTVELKILQSQGSRIIYHYKYVRKKSNFLVINR